MIRDELWNIAIGILGGTGIALGVLSLTFSLGLPAFLLGLLLVVLAMFFSEITR